MSSPLSELSDEDIPTTTKSKSPRKRSISDDDEDIDDVRSEASDAPAARKPRKLSDMFSDDDEDEDEKAPRSRSRSQSPRKRVAREEDFDSEEENVERKRRADSGTASSGGEDRGIQGDDLFGEDSDDDMKEAATPKRKERTLDDSELDSADDLDADKSLRRTGGYVDDDEVYQERVETSYEVDIGLHRLPTSTDDETYLLKVPKFISIEPSLFVPDEFVAPVPLDDAITPFNAATTAIRWRRSAKDPKKLESNSRIIRWSDGSLSLQIGSSKEGLYDMPSTDCLPPKGKPYRAAEDSFTFIAEPLANSRLIRCFSHATKNLAVIPASDGSVGDDVKKLMAASYAAARKNTTSEADNTVQLTYKMEDPERARREAEAAAKLKEKYERNRRTRELNRENGDIRAAYRAANRSYTRRRDEGMTAADLEGDEMEVDRQDRRRDKGSRGFGGGRGRAEREDEYDSDDGFVELSEDEEEVESESSEGSDRRRSSKSKSKSKSDKSKSSKRRARDEEDDEDEEEEAQFTDDDDLDDEPRPSKSAARASSEELSDGVPSGKHERKRRKMVVAEDSDEE